MDGDQTCNGGKAAPAANAVPSSLCHPFGGAPVATQHLALLSHVPVAGLLPPSMADVPTTIAGRDHVLRVHPVVLVEHEQLWRLDGLSLGDLVAELSLAPGEDLELETYRMERTLLQQSREDTSQFESSRDMAATDREAQSVAAVASKTNNWTATDSMDFSLGATIPVGKVPVEAKFGASSVEAMQEQVVASTDTRTEHAHEATVKAAQKLATQSKVVVSTSREVVSSVRQRRTIRNPASDAALHLYAYEVHKRYTVATWPRRARPALAVEVLPMRFNSEFVRDNPGFLAEALFDPVLAGKLDEAAIAASAVTTRGGDDALTVMENLLFRDTDPELIQHGAPPMDPLYDKAVFDLAWPRRLPFDKVSLLFWKQHYERIVHGGLVFGKPKDVTKDSENTGKDDSIEGTVKDLYAAAKFLWNVVTGDKPKASAPAKGAVVTTKFPGSVGGPRPDPSTSLEGDSGLWEWVQTPAARLFFEWRYMFWLWRASQLPTMSSAGRYWKGNRRELLERYGRQVQTDFEGLARGILVDFGETTQLARRLDAFLLIADTTFGTVSQEPPSRDAESALNAVVGHLNGHAEGYTSRHLGWLEKTSGRVGIRRALDEAVLFVDWGLSTKWVDFHPPPPGRWYDLTDVRRVGSTFYVPLRSAPPGGDPGDGPSLLREVVEALAAGAHRVAVTDSEVDEVLAGCGVGVELAGRAAAELGGGAGPWSSRQAVSAGAERFELAPRMVSARDGGAGRPLVTGKKADGEAGLAVGCLVKVSQEVRVLADGVHLVAAGSAC